MSFGQRFPSALPRVLEPMWKEWVQYRTCTKCNVRYDEMNNLGRWLCRVHLGAYNTHLEGQRYTIDHFECCGASRNVDDVHHEMFVPMGCYRTDHTIAMTPYGGPFFVSIVPCAFERFMKQPIPPASIVAHVISQQDEYKQLVYTDDALNTVRTKPIELEMRKRFDPVLHEVDDASFYSRSTKFIPYYVVRRTQTEQQDAERLRYFASRSADRHEKRMPIAYD